MTEDKRWTNEEISNYISRFTDVERDNVIRELMSSKILRSFLDTTEGRLLLDSTVDSIRDQMMKIVRLSIEDSKKNSDAIQQASLQINVAYDFIHGLAKTLTRGEEHESKMRGSNG
jgi:hypothetical protein